MTISTSHQEKDSTTKQHEMTRNKNLFVNFRFISWLNFFRFSAILACAIFLCVGNTTAQTKKSRVKKSAPKKQAVLNLPKVTQIDAEALKKLLKPNGKPLLINFWATWCEPCREEFPDLVKIGADYQDKIDLITISLDELSEINGDVPKFLAEVKSNSPAYLLKTTDEGEAIGLVAKDWQGGLPFTILFNADGETVYSKQGKFKTEFLRQQIEDLIQNGKKLNAFGRGRNDAVKDITEGKLILKTNEYLGRRRGLLMLVEERGIKFDYVCVDFEYIEGYNSISEKEIAQKFGDDFLLKITKAKFLNYPPQVIELTLTPK
ncbi:MAG: TlpA family protein disulfide reductase [Pyrinomonadaceae bacterium]|nr:TlpA family protein disulfide reductase [Pyrinomonadaceae bacterium]